MHKFLTLTVLTATLLAVPVSAQSMMHAGAFHALGAPTSGQASVSEAGGTLTVTLKDLKTEPGPGLQVWLYADAAPAKGAKDADIAKGKYVKVGELKKFSGTFHFNAPAGTKLADYKSVVLWCATVKTAFAAADLK